MKIALFDYIVTQDNAIGKCDLGILAALCHQHEFTVFSVQFDNPCPERIRWVRVPAPKRPLSLLYLVFHVLAPICYVWHRFRYRARFHFVQSIESNLSFGSIAYAHFCHHAFLKGHWSKAAAGGLRGALRWLDHWLRAQLEPWVYGHASVIVTPSHGLARELTAAYPRTATKIRVLANPVDLQGFRRPEGFDRESFRKNLGLLPQDIVLAFVALGHYERKGLPLLLRALAALQDPTLKVLVIGGSRNAISSYRERATRIGVNGNVKFFETQRDIRVYLWASDALALPSCYEVFPLVALEAAAAALPLLVTPLNGVEEFLRDSENGLLMRRDVNAVCECIARFAQMPPEARSQMGRRAQEDVRRYGMVQFASAWSNLYAEAKTHGR
jgi:glycosyltransferase involved in cell wall biosynthesis